MRSCRLAVEFRDAGVVAVGLGGSEGAAQAETFATAFALARQNGLHVVAHAGEHDGPRSIWAALDSLGAERIGHGIAARDDAKLLERLRRERVPLEICQTSNYRTRAILKTTAHPLLRLHDAGFVTVIDADDPALFETSITHEYALAAEVGKIPLITELAWNAIDASFASESRKQELRRELDSYLAIHLIQSADESPTS